jgi:hypothetical protein
LAFLAVFISVLATLIINTIVEKGPIIFLRVAEARHGEIDGVVHPYGNLPPDSQLFLNYSRIEELYGRKFNLGPRHYLWAVYTAEQTCGVYDTNNPKSRHEWRNSFDSKLGLPQRKDVSQINFDQRNAGDLILFKTELEREMELGRDYQSPPMGFGECYIR